ncbi:hypothetical protein RMN56_26795 [Micromonospora halotolerans]|uniref:Peptidase n=1 Tax=Micromonospora halotolerans TaxID=709879 RepID=A0ABY9ZWF5_9ACTN|nr:hypothetical protein [Micromonospora halotolerans]WNM38706.1 hypothetical protein RMN56_26795 [Micromonospora halotolerans]
MRKSALRLVTAVSAMALIVGPGLPAAAAKPALATTASQTYIYDLATATTSDPVTQAKIDRIAAQLPADWRARVAAVRAASGIEPSGLRNAIAAAIDPGDYECGDTAFSAWVDEMIGGIDIGTLFVLVIFGVLDYPTYDAVLYGSSVDQADYGLPAEYQNSMSRAFRAAQEFWDVPLGDVDFFAMQNDMLQDPERVARMVTLFLGLTGDDARSIAEQLVGIINSDPGLAGGNSPLFTLNAFAFSAADETEPPFAGLPDKMVFGEGMFTALEVLGISDAGPRAVLGHEMAHHVQYEAGLFNSPLTGPEATRRTELMADAFGTYFVTHARGLALNGRRVLEAERAFYEVGDCSFAADGHHGTPNQRLRASTWGADLADGAQKQGHILPTATLDLRFEQQLPVFVAPDANE